MNEQDNLTPRQAQIVDAALEIIAEHGIQGLTIKILAAKIAVTEGALYRHFKSKTDILAAIANMFKINSTRILEDVIKSGASGMDKLKQFFIGRCRQFAENHSLVMVLFSHEIFKGNEALQKEVHETIQQHKKLLISAIREGQQAHTIQQDVSPEHIFMVVMGAQRLLVTQWNLSNFAFDLAAEGEKLWDAVERLIAA